MTTRLNDFDSLPINIDMEPFAIACIATEGVKAPVSRFEVRSCVRRGLIDEREFDDAMRDAKFALAN